MSHESFLERMMMRVWVSGLLQFSIKWLSLCVAEAAT